jgi:hypothetical protein
MERGFFERRGRKGYAKGAKKKYRKKLKTSFKSSLSNKHMNGVNFKFCIDFLLFFAPSAKPLRPLRSKTPRIQF